MLIALAACAASLIALPCPLPSTPSGAPAQDEKPQPPLLRNFHLDLSEDEAVDASLESALIAFLAEARSRTLSPKTTDPADVAAHGFYFKELQGMASTEHRVFQTPTVLKSYSENGRDYFITVSFSLLEKGVPYVYRVLEFKAVPHAGTYRFHCPLQDRTKNFRSTTVDRVTFHHSGSLNPADAEEFARFYASFCRQTKTQAQPLDYYKFATLDEMLTSHGILFSASKCNFLAYDLGLLESDDRTYLTGTNDAAYIPGFVEDYLERHVPGADQIYRPCAVGMAVCYGGYYTTQDDLPTLKEQFKKALAERHDLDFLEEFRKARGASINRHFCHYVMCAFLCEEVLKNQGFDAALRLVHSGRDGERFFKNLKALLNVDESNFHDTILRMINEEAPAPAKEPIR